MRSVSQVSRERRTDKNLRMHAHVCGTLSYQRDTRWLILAILMDKIRTTGVSEFSRRFKNCFQIRENTCQNNFVKVGTTRYTKRVEMSCYIDQLWNKFNRSCINFKDIEEVFK